MTLVVKLGSSIVAGEEGALRKEVLDSVCEQVGELAHSGEDMVMVTSGAIARGIRLMRLPIRPRGIDELQAASAVGQGNLFRAYESRLAENGVRAAQILLTANDLAGRSTYLNARRTLRRLIEWGVVPVVNENDTTATDEITFGDNDFLAAQVAVLLDARLLVLLTDTDGLYSTDPRRDPGARLVTEVTSAEELSGLDIGDRTSPFGTGGMRSKVAAAEMACEAGSESVICNGTVSGTLLSAAAGEQVGTRFKIPASSRSAFKLWLKHAKPAQGWIEVDSGAARVLREAGSSLLPVGITGVGGEFRAGDGVEVRHGGDVIGKGIAECSARELDEIKGRRSKELRGIAPEEAIHRDRFVLL